MWWVLLVSMAHGRPTCPVVDVPAPLESGSAMEWMAVVGDTVVGTDGDHMYRWPIRDGGSATVLAEGDLWPHWTWYVDGEQLRNQATGATIALGSGARTPAADIRDPHDRVGYGDGWMAWSRYSAPSFTVWSAGEERTVPWSGDDRAQVVARDRDGRHWWVGSDVHVVRLDANGVASTRFDAAPIAVRAIAVHPSKPQLAVVGYYGVVNLFDLETKAARWSWPGDGRPSFSPDGRWLLLARYDGADLVEVETGCLKRTLPIRETAVWLADGRLAWVDDARRLHVEKVSR